MPDLLEGLEQLARERGDALQRASRELAGEPEGFLIVAREVCTFVGLLSDCWAVMGLRFRSGGVPAKQLLQVCDVLLHMGEEPAHYLGLVVRVWHERNLPAGMAEPIYAEVQSARGRLDSLMEEIRKTREWAATPPRISPDPEDLRRRIKQADEGGEWMRVADAVSRMRRGSPPKQE